jgi:nucleotide-binding universal stress UspA family protein
MLPQDQEFWSTGHAGGISQVGEILVPLDGSEQAERILDHAGPLASATGGTLVLLGVVPPPPTNTSMVWAAPGMPPIAWEEERKAALDAVATYLRGVAHTQTGAGRKVQIHVAEGDPAAEIVAYATAHPISLIAMATHGRSGIGRWIFGSVAQAVLHVAPVPLLLVRGTAPVRRARPYRTILVPMDGSAFAEQALDEAYALAVVNGASLVLMAAVLDSVDPTGLDIPIWVQQARESNAVEMETYLRQQAKRLQTAGLTVETQIIAGEPAEAILRAGDLTNADLIVMATHGRTGLQQLRMGSVALKVVQGSNRPVILVRAAHAGVYPPSEKIAGDLVGSR